MSVYITGLSLVSCLSFSRHDSLKKQKNDKIRHLATCVVATLQDRYQTSTTSVFWCKIFITHRCQNVHLRFQTAAVGNGHQLLCGPNVILVLKNRQTAWQMPQAAASPQYVIILCIYILPFKNKIHQPAQQQSNPRTFIRMRRRARSSRKYYIVMYVE